MRKEFKDALSQAFTDCIQQACLLLTDADVFKRWDWQDRCEMYNVCSNTSFMAAETLYHLCESRGVDTRLPTGKDVSPIFTDRQADHSFCLAALDESLVHDPRYDYPDYINGNILLDVRKKTQDTFRAVILAMAWALKEGDRQAADAMLGSNPITRDIAFCMCYSEEIITGIQNPQMMMFIPDTPRSYDMAGNLADMAEEMTASLQPGHFPMMLNTPELMFFRIEGQPGRCNISILGDGRLVRCETDDSGSYILTQIDRWLDRLRRENPY